MHVLRTCAEEVGCGLYEAPLFTSRQRIADKVPNLCKLHALYIRCWDLRLSDVCIALV